MLDAHADILGRVQDFISRQNAFNQATQNRLAALEDLNKAQADVARTQQDLNRVMQDLNCAMQDRFAELGEWRLAQSNVNQATRHQFAELDDVNHVIVEKMASLEAALREIGSCATMLCEVLTNLDERLRTMEGQGGKPLRLPKFKLN
jgi:hypothetical protein